MSGVSVGARRVLGVGTAVPASCASVLALALAAGLSGSGSLAYAAEPAADPGARQVSETDGQHAFDFDLGTWKTHSRRLLHPLSDSQEWVEMDGVTVVRPIWGGNGNLAELEADGPRGHLELLSLRLYDPTAHEWNLNFATSGVGVLNVSGAGVQGVPLIGRFSHGRGEFYDQEPFNGRTIWVRFSIEPLSPTTARSEQAFSDDNGRTWQVNWINDYTRLAEPK